MTMRQILPDEKVSYTSANLPSNLGGGTAIFERHGRMVVMTVDTVSPTKGSYVSALAVIPQGYRPWNDADYFPMTACGADGMLQNSTAYVYIDKNGNLGIMSYGDRVIGTVAYIAAP